MIGLHPGRFSISADTTWPYWPFYCEENAWYAVTALARDYTHTAVLWILGRGGRVAIWRQRLAARASHPLAWDYHVVALARTDADSEWAVFDPDSTLPRGLPARSYLAQAFPPGSVVPRAFRPCFRWFDGEDYRRRLNATRRHMVTADGKWEAPPPPWPLICSGAAEAFDVPQLRDADCRALPSPLGLNELCDLLDSSVAARGGFTAPAA